MTLKRTEASAQERQRRYEVDTTEAKVNRRLFYRGTSCLCFCDAVFFQNDGYF